MMKKKLELEHEQEHEILKAVAQAWYGHSTSISKPSTNEFDAHRRNFKSQPSRFQLEASKKSSSSSSSSLAKETTSASWDFKQSLWDSYEIVTVSKRLEAGLLMDNPFSSGFGELARVHRRPQRRESKNSLRNLFSHFSSRRYEEVEDPQDDR